MANGKFLHQHPEFYTLIEALAVELGTYEIVVEKDYWVMHSIYGLQRAGYRFPMKGGTTLTKGYGLIDRFSEDVDVHSEPPSGLKLPTRGRYRDQYHCQERRKYFDVLASKIQIQGMRTVRDHNYDDPVCCEHGGILLEYDSHYADVSGALKRGVLLEVGFETPFPTEPKDMTSWAFAAAMASGFDICDNRAMAVECYLPEYTLIEKIDAVTKKHWKFRRDGIPPINYIRHYYDIHCLLKDEKVRAFTHGKTFKLHMSKRTRHPGRVMPLSKNPALLLSNPEEFAIFERSYIAKKVIYYQGQPAFKDVLTTIRDWVANLPE